ncbi:MAG: transglutaminase-like domain-containing protein [Sulfuricurvum sp.]
MHRREFIKKTAILSVAYCLPAFASVQKATDNSAIYDLEWRFDLSHYQNQECSLWIPLPSNISGFQKVLELGVQTDAKIHFETTNNAYDARTLYAHWDKEASVKTVRISLKVALENRQCSFKTKRISPDEVKKAEQFLAPTAHVPTDGAVAYVAHKIVGNEKDPLKKARKIYNWIVANSYRDEAVLGCGVGSPNAMLAALEKEGRMGGKCLDMSALTVALMRAVGIPAREVLGLRIGASTLSAAFGTGEENTKAQHCKVEFFIPAMGWIPCDPADITKLILKENIAPLSPRAQEMSVKFFGFWENNWMALNRLRDAEIYPANTQGMLDSFGYPYAEVAGEYLDPFDPKAYHYIFRSQKVSL